MKAARQSGFTLIELVVVITILGILAAFAIPRFAALDQQARIAARDGLAGSVRSGAALAHAMWLAQGQPPAAITIEGAPITFTNGYPNIATMDDMIANLASSGFVYTAGAASGVFARAAPFAACTVTYTPPTGPNLPPTIAVSAGATTC